MAVDTNMRVLIVDDYKSMLSILRKLLEQINFNNVEEAIDGSEALEKLKEDDAKYGLIISDWNMEPMNGIQLLREVREEDALKLIPFIMISAESKSENVIAAKDAGVSSFIVKPFNAGTLKAKMVSVLGQF
jgi:two-component system chemotaxis response regulator CheY